MNVFSAVFLVVFAVFGVIAFLKELTGFVFRNKSSDAVVFIAPINKNQDDAEYILRSVAARIKWISRGKSDSLICLDCDMDEETRRICESICNEYGFAKLMNKKEFFEALEKSQ